MIVTTTKVLLVSQPEQKGKRSSDFQMTTFSSLGRQRQRPLDRVIIISFRQATHSPESPYHTRYLLHSYHQHSYTTSTKHTAFNAINNSDKSAIIPQFQLQLIDFSKELNRALIIRHAPIHSKSLVEQSNPFNQTTARFLDLKNSVDITKQQVDDDQDSDISRSKLVG